MWRSGVTVAGSIGTNPLRGCAAIYNDLFGSYLHTTNVCEHFSGTLDNFHDGRSRQRLKWGKIRVIPPLHWQLKSGAGWSEGPACSACVLSSHIESCTPWCDSNHHTTRGIVNETVVCRYHRLTCVQHSPGLSTRPHCSRVNFFFLEVCHWLKTYFAKSTYE